MMELGRSAFESADVSSARCVRSDSISHRSWRKGVLRVRLPAQALFGRGIMARSTVTLFGLVLLAMPLAGCGMTSGSAPQPQVAAVPPPSTSNSPILDSLDPADRGQAEQARSTALDGKAKVSIDWKSASNPLTHGSVVAGPVADQNGMQCRPYSQTVYLNGVPSISRMTACRQPNGSWSNVAPAANS
jgi:surface antigen